MIHYRHHRLLFLLFDHSEAFLRRQRCLPTLGLSLLRLLLIQTFLKSQHIGQVRVNFAEVPSPLGSQSIPRLLFLPAK